MTTKEKAIDLVNKYVGLNSNKLSDYSRIEFPTAKQCALIAIDEIVEHINELDDSEWYLAMKQHIHDLKQEIEKL
jgi:hypothetical protein